MSNVVISVENLSKEYRLGVLGHGTLRQDLQSWWAYRRGKEDPNSIVNTSARLDKKNNENFWALRDVSFQVKQGELLGIIGLNGAGKSTLLKILSRVTAPTSGSIKIKGRIASLLEVGTGFHPELTGRENVYLNGSILGMTKKEIDKRFDEIVAFSEVEKFIDTPVKRYSSGMYVRLAFAVAAHLDAEILILDEVLAVGDAQFQKKCLGKMESVGKDGRTVLFVSHNMNAVENLCNRGILLEKGRIKDSSSDVRSLIKNYVLDNGSGVKSVEWINKTGQDFDSEWFKPARFYLSDREGKKLDLPVSNSAEMWVNIEGEIKQSDPLLTIGYAIYSEDGDLLYWTYPTDVAEEKWQPLKKGKCLLRSQIPPRFLNEGTYKIELIASIHFRKWLCEPKLNAPAINLTIQGGLSDSPYWIAKRPGLIAPVMEWDIATLS